MPSVMSRVRAWLPRMHTQAGGVPAHVAEAVAAKQRAGLLAPTTQNTSPAPTPAPVPPPRPHIVSQPLSPVRSSDESGEDAIVDVDLEQQSLLAPAAATVESDPPGSVSFRSTPQSTSVDPSQWEMWCNNGDTCGLVCIGFTWFLLLWPAYALYSRVLGPWATLWDDWRGIELMIVYFAIAAMALFAHTKAMTTDPGAIPYGCLPIVPPPESGLYPSCAHCAYNYKPPRAHRESTCTCVCLNVHAVGDRLRLVPVRHATDSSFSCDPHLFDLCPRLQHLPQMHF